MPITFTVTVVERAGETIMFDSGTGGGQAGGPKAGLLAKQNMKAAGIEADKIAKIIVTHYHSDHIFGMMEKDTNTLLYPNAEIIVPASEHTYWTEPGLIEKLPGGAPRPRQAHPGHHSDLEERAAGGRQRRGRARHSLDQHERSYTRPYSLCIGIRQRSAPHLRRCDKRA